MASITHYRPAKTDWPVLVLTALSFSFIVSMPMASVSVLFKEISRDLNLDVVQIGSVWGMISLGSIFISPIGGIVCDRIGAGRTIVLIGVVSGLVGAARAFSGSFLTLMTTTFLWGLVSSAIIPALTLSASQVTTEQKQGLAQGFLGVGGGLGFILGSLMSAAVVSPLVGGWRYVFVLYGAISVLTGLIWLFKTRSAHSIRSEVPRHTTPFFPALIRILHMKEFWLIGLTLMAYQGCLIGTQGYLPYFLQGAGWSAVAAGGALAAFSGGGTIGVIPLSLLSDNLGSRKVFLYISFLFSIVGVGLISLVQGGALWILVIIGGFFFQMNSALITALFIEKIPAGESYSGTALGFIFSMGLVGRALFPPLGNSLENISGYVAWPFVFWAGLGIAGVIILGLIKENGRARRQVKYAVEVD